jgi:cellulose synthase (UDP-forming)
MQEQKLSTIKSIFIKYIYTPIYNFVRRNIRILVALVFIIYISYPVVSKIIEVSKAKSFFSSQSQAKPTLPDLTLNKFNFGAYDNTRNLDSVKSLTFQSDYLIWDHTLDQDRLGQAMDNALSKGRYPLITIEPWNYSNTQSNTDYFLDIVNGKYDTHITNICKKINSYRTVTLVSWGEGADYGVKSRYSWAIADSNLYKQGYMRWHDKCKAMTNNVIFVWTAHGTDQTIEYYPGDPYVDLIGVNSLITDNQLKNSNNKDQEVEVILNNKIKNATNINKVIYLMNLGLENPSKNQDYLNSIVSQLKNAKFPQVLGAIYLNTNDSPTIIPGDKSLDFILSNSQATIF